MNENVWIFVCTHGRFGEELIRSAEMIAGKVNNVYSFPLLQGMTPEAYREELTKKLEEAPSGVLCLVDLFGGTPSNTCAILSKSYDMEILTGLNLAMYIEITSQLMNLPLSELKQHGITTLRESAKDVVELLKERM